MKAGRTHCKNGHAFDEDNTYLFFNKKKNKDVRTCRKCNLIRVKRRHIEAAQANRT